MYVDILCELKNPAASYPTRAYEYDAAWDLYSVQYAEVGPTAIVIDTGIACALPKDYCAVLFGRSGLASQSVTPLGWVIEDEGRIRLGGVMDAGYRGNYRVMLATIGQTTHLVRPGEAIAQMLILPRPQSRIIPVGPGCLPASERGTKGFGSSDRPASVYSAPATWYDRDNISAFHPINPDVPSSGLSMAHEGPSSPPVADPPTEAEGPPMGLLDALAMSENLLEKRRNRRRT